VKGVASRIEVGFHFCVIYRLTPEIRASTRRRAKRDDFRFTLLFEYSFLKAIMFIVFEDAARN
jgi:hypothetical protein